MKYVVLALCSETAADICRASTFAVNENNANHRAMEIITINNIIITINNIIITINNIIITINNIRIIIMIALFNVGVKYSYATIKYNEANLSQESIINQSINYSIN